MLSFGTGTAAAAEICSGVRNSADSLRYAVVQHEGQIGYIAAAVEIGGVAAAGGAGVVVSCALIVEGPSLQRLEVPEVARLCFAAAGSRDVLRWALHSCRDCLPTQKLLQDLSTA